MLEKLTPIRQAGGLRWPYTDKPEGIAHVACVTNSCDEFPPSQRHMCQRPSPSPCGWSAPSSTLARSTPGRTGRNHLRITARTNGVSRHRVDEVLEQVGVSGAAGRRIKGYSLGMRQRLGIAAALLADPRVLLFDEPINGLDLDGVRWIRGLLRQLAADGRTVLVSSHLMSEVQQTADRLVVVGRGRLLADTTTRELLRGIGHLQVRVHSPRLDALAPELEQRGLVVHQIDPDVLTVEDTTAAKIGDLAHSLDIPLHHLSEVEQSLEDAYLRLTRESLEHHDQTPRTLASRRHTVTAQTSAPIHDAATISAATVLARTCSAEWTRMRTVRTTW